MRELHELFLDMSMLVEDQGTLVDRIEDNVLKARDFVDQASTTLRRARVAHDKYRKKKILFAGILTLVIAIVILVPILVKYPAS